MCGRFAIVSPASELIEAFGLASAPAGVRLFTKPPLPFRSCGNRQNLPSSAAANAVSRPRSGGGTFRAAPSQSIAIDNHSQTLTVRRSPS